MPSLLQKLNKLGMNLGAQTIMPNQNIKRPIDQVLDGKRISTSNGDVFVYQKDNPLPYIIGAEYIEKNVNNHLIYKWAHHHSTKKDRIAFIDTETSGISGGTGTFIFLFGFCEIKNTSLHVTQIFLLDPSSETLFLEVIRDALAPFNILTTYNGKSFDIPILKTRCTLNQIPDMTQEIFHIDLLHLVRKIWKFRLPERSLHQIETNILQFDRSEDEIPGYLVPEYYVNYLRTGDASPLKRVFYHNEMDVISLAAIFQYLSKFIGDPFFKDLPEALDIYSLALLYESWGKLDISLKLYEECLNLNCDKTLSGKVLANMANIYKKYDKNNIAIKFWIKAARLGQIDSFIELSKYHEHNERDYKKSLYWLNQYEMESLKSKEPIVTKFTADEINIRKKRLLTKMLHA